MKLLTLFPRLYNTSLSLCILPLPNPLCCPSSLLPTDNQQLAAHICESAAFLLFSLVCGSLLWPHYLCTFVPQSLCQPRSRPLVATAQRHPSDPTPAPSLSFLNIHLNYLGPVSCFSASWVPLRVYHRVSCSGSRIYGHNILCLLKRQVTFFVYKLMGAKCFRIIWNKTDICSLSHIPKPHSPNPLRRALSSLLLLPMLISDKLWWLLLFSH